MRTLYVSLMFLCVTCVASCVRYGAKEHAEQTMHGFLGKLPSETYGGRGIRCAQMNATSCVKMDGRGCIIEYRLDKSSGRIVEWSYRSKPELCWSSAGR
jgi:hypothetical protein